MDIGIVGLGLIGGSLAKAISQNTNHTVYGTDISDSVVKKAVLVNAIEQPLTNDILSHCDIIIVALYPKATIDYVKAHAHLIKKGAIVLDCGGVKGIVCDALMPLAEEKGFIFIGGHPMAGSYKDLTHVAKLNENMWTELFLDNAENLTMEIDSLIAELQKYSSAIKSNDAETLKALLKDGREKKERIDNERF